MTDHNRGFWQFFVHNHRFTTVVVIACVLLGLLSMALIRKESNPEVNVPIGVVITTFPGANSRDTEELITTPLEDKILSLSAIDKVTSTSGKGLSSIVVQFNANSDTKEQIANLKEKIEEAKPQLPSEATDPLVRQISFNDRPVYTFALSGPYSLPQLKNFAQSLQADLERVTGVSEVKILGGREAEIQVVVDKIRLDELGVDLNQVITAIQLANTDIPAGAIEQNNEVVSLRFQGRINSAAEIGKIPIVARGAAVILIQDLATVIDGFSPQNSLSRLSKGGENTLPAVTLQIYKTGTGDIGEIGAAANAIIAKNQDLMAENLVFETIEDWSEIINKDLNKLFNNGLQTVAVIMLLLLFFVGWREAVLAGISIPLTFLITFAVLYSMGYTLNFLSLFSLILALGILVDATIVITEGMANRIQEGKSPKEAALMTIDEFKLPLVSGTLTTVFAFLPMLLTSGIMGEFIKSIPVTVSVVLLTALFVALAVITSFGARFLRNRKELNKRENRLMNGLQNLYSREITTFLNRPRRRKLLLTVMVLLFFLSFSLPLSGILEVNMFPPEDEDTFYIDLESPIGTTLTNTDRDTRFLEDDLLTDKRIKSFLVNVGSSNDSGSGSVLSGNVSSIIAKVAPDSPEKSLSLIEEYNRKFSLSEINGTVRVSQRSSGPGDSAPVEVVIEGKDLTVLDRVADDIKKMLSTIKGSRDIRDTIKTGNGEIALSVNSTKAEYYGVKNTQIASLLRQSVTGVKATTLRKDGESVDVIVKHDLSDFGLGVGPDGQDTNRANLDTIKSLTINTTRGPVPLSEFLTGAYVADRSAINHKNGNRVVSVTGRVGGGVSAQSIFKALETKLADYELPEGYLLQMGGEREDINQSLSDMARAMILAIFLIGALLVWQFHSYRQPLFILMSIPLALIGVFPGLSIVNLPLSFPAIIGIVALAGIVVNNAIILVDRINENRYRGSTKAEAIIEAGRSRLQPIILTTITTVLGILPLALNDPTWGPLGFAIIFGLVFSTVLTLFVIPLLYFAFGEKNIAPSE